MTARLVEMRVRGLRTLADVTLPLEGLTVLIGDNGTGKSSLLEALRIASLVVRPEFVEVLNREHMLGSAIRNDMAGLKLDLRVEDGSHNLVYSLLVDASDRIILRESIQALVSGVDLLRGESAETDPDVVVPIVRRLPEKILLSDRTTQRVSPMRSIFEYFGRATEAEAVALVREVLEGIDTHLPFDVGAVWAKRSTGRGSAMREPALLGPSQRLGLFGTNLANAYQQLKNSSAERWRDTIEMLQLGLGPGLQDVLLPVAGGGHIDLALDLRGVGRVQALQLADGQLTYLAFVALVQLDPGRTLLSFDEPEQHLHPALLNRVLQLFEDASTRYPVILATHSDRLLDFLPDPAAAVRVCELDSHHKTVLRKLDPEQLDKWLQHYGGVGAIRAGGQLSSILAYDEDSAA